MHLRRVGLPFWSRVALFAGVGLVALGAGFSIYRYATKSTVLTVAVGSLDGQATQAALALGGHLAAADSGFRFEADQRPLTWQTPPANLPTARPILPSSGRT